jgi:hypothetical protein
MSRTALHWALTFSLSMACPAYGDNEQIRADRSDRYLLVTWDPSNKTDVCFTLIPSKDREKFARRWFPKRTGKCGIANLKNALRTLPQGALVLWEDTPRPGFNYPAANIIEEIRRYAKARGINVLLAPNFR